MKDFLKVDILYLSLSSEVHLLNPPVTTDTNGLAPMGLDAIGKLTDPEWECLRKMGGCFWCQKPGHLACDCPTSNQQAPQIYTIDTEDQELGKE